VFFIVMLFLVVLRSSPRIPLFPYTTLFRSPAGPAAPAGAPAQRRGRGGRRRRAAGPPVRDRAQLAGRPARGPDRGPWRGPWPGRSEEHTSELQSRENLVCRLLLEKKK